MHTNRGYVVVSSTSLLGATEPATNSMQTDYAVLFTTKPRRGIGTMLRDLCLIVLGWTLFIGLMAYPAAYLVGLVACAIALVVLPAERRSMVTDG